MDFHNHKPTSVQAIPEALLAGLSIMPSAVFESDQAYFAVYERDADVLDVKQMVEQIK